MVKKAGDRRSFLRQSPALFSKHGTLPEFLESTVNKPQYLACYVVYRTLVTLEDIWKRPAYSILLFFGYNPPKGDTFIILSVTLKWIIAEFIYRALYQI